MLSALANKSFSVHIFPPVKQGNEWYGSALLRIGDHEVKLMASASEGLMKAAYGLAAKHMSYGPTVSGCEGCSPAMPTTFVGRLAGLAPFIPTEGLAPNAQAACALLLRASAGCESCVDRLTTIHEHAATGDPTATDAKVIINGLLNMALVRQGAVQRVARMNPDEFHAFLSRLQ